MAAHVPPEAVKTLLHSAFSFPKQWYHLAAVCYISWECPCTQCPCCNKARQKVFAGNLNLHFVNPQYWRIKYSWVETESIAQGPVSTLSEVKLRVCEEGSRAAWERQLCQGAGAGLAAMRRVMQSIQFSYPSCHTRHTGNVSSASAKWPAGLRWVWRWALPNGERWIRKSDNCPASSLSSSNKQNWNCSHILLFSVFTGAVCVQGPLVGR